MLHEIIAPINDPTIAEIERKPEENPNLNSDARNQPPVQKLCSLFEFTVTITVLIVIFHQSTKLFHRKSAIFETNSANFRKTAENSNLAKWMSYSRICVKHTRDEKSGSKYPVFDKFWVLYEP